MKKYVTTKLDTKNENGFAISEFDEEKFELELKKKYDIVDDHIIRFISVIKGFRYNSKDSLVYAFSHKRNGKNESANNS